MINYNSSFQENNNSYALGLEETTSGVWKLFTAVIIHAVAIVFCIGEQLYVNIGIRKKHMAHA
jgi:hypothetical protein